jgi:hypothetical protein
MWTKDGNPVLFLIDILSMKGGDIMAKGFPNKSTAFIKGSIDRDTPSPKVIKGNDLRTKGK